MKQAIALYRVSTKRQSEEGHSLEAQEQRVLKAAATWEAEIVNSWKIDASSRVGKNLARKDLREALAYCKRHKSIELFIIDEVDRFMRSIEEYYWYKVEFKKIGVKLVFASQPELSEEGQFAKLRELLAVYESESSNAERTRKTFEQMKVRVEAGFYPFNAHPGYKKTVSADGLHVPNEPLYSILREGSRHILKDGYTPPQAVRWMNEQGYRTKAGHMLTLDHYIGFITDPYYCGDIVINKPGWPKTARGLHEPMFSRREHELLTAVLKNRTPRVRQSHNPEFPMASILRHEECVGKGGYEKFTGVYFNTGKRPNGKQRKLKPVYDCRDCRRRLPRDRIHDNMTRLLQSLELVPSKEALIKALMQVWKNQRGITEHRLRSLKAQRAVIEEEKRKATLEYVGAVEPAIKVSIGALIEDLVSQIHQIDIDIHRTQDIQLESEEFVRFAINFVESIKDGWWLLSPDERKRGEQILFNGKIFADDTTKIRTPELSTIYRLGTNKKDLGKVSLSKMVELVGTAPTSAGLSWLFLYRLSPFSKSFNAGIETNKHSALAIRRLNGHYGW